MTAYERVEGGRVVERVQTIDGSNEDTRIGCMVMDKQGGWQLAGTPIEPDAPAPHESAATAEEAVPAEEQTSSTEESAAAEEPPIEATSAKDTTTKPKRGPRAQSEE